MDITRFEEILDSLAEELPPRFYDELNGGILLLPEEKLSTHARDNDLYILGEYTNNGIYGRYVAIYYGSFEALYGHLPEEALTVKMRQVLRHEFRHHLENLAGDKTLEREDEKNIWEYLNREE